MQKDKKMRKFIFKFFFKPQKSKPYKYRQNAIELSSR